MMVQILSILLVIVSGILCSGTQQGVSSTQAGQTLQIQPNVRKYNKHTATEKPCATGSTTGTRKEKPENYSDTPDYVAIGGGGGGNGGGVAASPAGYPYPYAPYAPYPYQPYQPGAVLVQPGSGVGNYPYRLQYPYEPQYPVEAPAPQYYPAPAPYYPPAPYPASPYPASPYPAAYPAAYPPPSQQQLYEQSAVVVDAYRSPYPQQQEQLQFHRQPVAGPYYAQPPPPPPPHFRAHAYNRPTAPVTPAFLQQRDAAATTPATSAANEPSQQYEPAGGTYDSSQYHY